MTINNGLADVQKPIPSLMLVAEATQAVRYLMRAEEWAAEVDEEIVADIVVVHKRLLEKIDSLRDSRRIR